LTLRLIHGFAAIRTFPINHKVFPLLCRSLLGATLHDDMPKRPRFEILRVEHTGPRSIAVTDTVEQAKSTVLRLDRGWETRFIISNKLSGERIIFNGHYFLVDK
jgi:hypothetical protein